MTSNIDYSDGQTDQIWTDAQDKISSQADTLISLDKNQIIWLRLRFNLFEVES